MFTVVVRYVLEWNIMVRQLVYLLTEIIL